MTANINHPFFVSSRHLNATETARVAGRFLDGVNFSGCTKGRILTVLEERRYVTAELLFALRTTRSARGEFGVTEVDRPAVVAARDAAEAALDAAQREHAQRMATGRIQYDLVNVTIPKHQRELQACAGALAHLDAAIPVDARKAALARLQAALADQPALLADLALVAR